MEGQVEVDGFVEALDMPCAEILRRSGFGGSLQPGGWVSRLPSGRGFIPGEELGFWVEIQ